MEETFRKGVTVTDAMDRFNEKGLDLIVEVNNRFIFPAAYSATVLRDGDRIEFIHADFGG